MSTRNTGDVLRHYEKVLIPEMNAGQLSLLVRARFLVDAKSFTKVQGIPIFAEELEREIVRVLDIFAALEAELAASRRGPVRYPVLTAGAAIETLRTTSMGGTGAINLTGNAFSQTITGNAGANALTGTAFADTIVGGAVAYQGN